MAFQYASYTVPQAPPSSLAAFGPAFDAANQKRLDLEGAKAAAGLYSNSGPYQQQPPPQSLAALDPNAGRPQSNPQNPPTVGDRASQLDAYTNSVGQRESSGNPNAVNPASGATGLYQFLPSTWQDLMQRHPELGLTPEGIADPAQQQKAMPVFTAENAKQLAASGVQPNPTSLYAAHLLGGGGASKVLSQPDNTPLSAVVDPAALQANPNIAGMNVGQFKQWVAQQGPQGQGGGYTPPMAQGGAPQAGQPMGLPSRETMLALFRSPEMRPLAIEIAKTIQAGQSPAALLDLAYKRAQIAQVGLPDGYQRTADGTMRATPGGPDDPANPLNALKVGAFGQVMSGNAQVGLGPQGVADPAQQAQFLQSLPAPVAAMVKGVADYQLDPSKITSLRGNQRQQLIQMVQQYDPSFDMTQYGVRNAMRKSVSTGAYSQALNSANLVIQHLDALSNAADALHNQGFTPWNAISNTAKGVTGDPAITNFNTIADAAGAELAKVFKGSGASDVQSIQEWRHNLDANSSPDQIKGAISTAIGQLLKSRIDTIQNQYKSAMGRPADFHFLTPESRQVLTDLGIDPSTIDPADAGAPTSDATQAPPATPAQPQQAAPPPAAGPTATNPATGEKLALQNGQWVPVK